MIKGDLIKVPVIADPAKPVDHIWINRTQLDRVAQESVLDTWLPESVAFYACSDGPVLVIWGRHNNKLAIRGLTMEVETLHEESQFRIAWQRHQAKDLTVADVHRNILEVLGTASN